MRPTISDDFLELVEVIYKERELTSTQKTCYQIIILKRRQIQPEILQSYDTAKYR